MSALPKELFEAIIAIVPRRTRGTNFPPHKKQRVETELLDLLYTKLREGQAFRELTFKALARELADIARTLAGDDEEINLIAANHPHAFSNMVTVLFQNEFRKGAAKERLGARTKGSSAASSRGFARVLANFAPSDDPAADMAQFWRRCVDAGLGEDKLKAVRLMRHFQSAPDSDDDEPNAQDAGMQSMVPAGRVVVGGANGTPGWGFKITGTKVTKTGSQRSEASRARAWLATAGNGDSGTSARAAISLEVYRGSRGA